MTIEDAIKHYGTSKEIARLLRKSPGRISQFKAAGGFPYELQCVLEKHSNGALTASRDDDPNSKADAA